MTESEMRKLAQGGAVSTIDRHESHVWETIALFVAVFGIGALMLLAGGGQ